MAEIQSNYQRLLPKLDPDKCNKNYIDLLEPDRYYTTAPGRRVQRQRVMDNLLGGRAFCPIIRRTEKLAALEEIDLQKRCQEVKPHIHRDFSGGH